MGDSMIMDVVEQIDIITETIENNWPHNSDMYHLKRELLAYMVPHLVGELDTVNSIRAYVVTDVLSFDTVIILPQFKQFIIIGNPAGYGNIANMEVEVIEFLQALGELYSDHCQSTLGEMFRHLSYHLNLYEYATTVVVFNGKHFINREWRFLQTHPQYIPLTVKTLLDIVKPYCNKNLKILNLSECLQEIVSSIELEATLWRDDIDIVEMQKSTLLQEAFMESIFFEPSTPYSWLWKARTIERGINSRPPLSNSLDSYSRTILTFWKRQQHSMCSRPRAVRGEPFLPELFWKLTTKLNNMYMMLIFQNTWGEEDYTLYRKPIYKGLVGILDTNEELQQLCRRIVEDYNGKIQRKHGHYYESILVKIPIMPLIGANWNTLYTHEFIKLIRKFESEYRNAILNTDWQSILHEYKPIVGDTLEVDCI